MQIDKSIEVCQVEEKLRDENESDTNGYESDDNVNENIEDANILVDEENTFEEPDIYFVPIE